MRRFRLRYAVIDSDGNAVAVFDTKAAAKEARDKWELEGAKFAHPSGRITFGEPVRMPKIVEIRNTPDSEWRHYETITSLEELEKAQRLVGYGDNVNHYRIIDLPDDYNRL